MSSHKTQSAAHRSLAAELLRVGAVAFSPGEPFVWASGITSPVYCDNRVTMAFPEVRRQITDGFQEVLDARRLMPDVVVGTATAGIPHAAWLADRLGLPLAYVRSSAKHHGRRNQIEGRVTQGQTAVVVEDLISTGGSSLATVRVLRQAGLEVPLVVAIFSYGLPAALERFAAEKASLETLTDFDALVEEAVAARALAPDAVDRIREWHRGLAATMGAEAEERG